MSKLNTVLLQVRLPSDEHDVLRKLAFDQRLPMSTLVRKALRKTFREYRDTHTDVSGESVTE